RAKNNSRRNVFTKTRMRACKGGGLGDCRVAQEGCVYSNWRILLAATVDQLLDPTVQGEKAVLVETSDVTGAMPAINESRPVEFRITQVPRGESGPAHKNLALLARRKQAAVCIHDDEGAKPR